MLPIRELHAEEPPEISIPEDTAGSSVVFFPGIKGSRLYDGNGNKLWEPFGNQDIEALMLDANGNSIRNDILTEPGDIIDSIAGFMDIYGSFMDFMNGLVEEGAIYGWSPVSYDWRLSLTDIARDRYVPGPIPLSEKKGYAGLPLRQILESVASGSATGKVTIIAHSNGGLVAKQLVQQLGLAETARLIDKVILIGVPQSGAPQALAALLYGYEEGIPTWLPGIVSTPMARKLAQNSPMAYHLLPSQKYFDAMNDPRHAVVMFKDGAAYDIERDAYGESIDTFDELAAFATAEEGGREMPTFTRTDQASVLNPELLAYAKSVHEELDAWTPPPGVQMYQLAGWGVNTVSGIEYYQRCALTLCASLYRPVFTEDGDGVVPIPSALMLNDGSSAKRYWLNLDKYGFGPIGNKDHGTILAIPDLRILLKNILKGDSNSLPLNITSTQPRSAESEKKLLFFLHSPLTLELYDKDGNRVGPNENGTKDEEIDGARYGVFGDVQYVIAPAEEEYRLEMRGYDSGTFTLEASEVENGEVISEVAFVEIPVTPDTVARMGVHANFAEHVLEVDADGDGVIDMTLREVSQEAVDETSQQSDAPQRKSSKKSGPVIATESIEELQMRLYRLLLELLLVYLEARTS